MNKRLFRFANVAGVHLSLRACVLVDVSTYLGSTFGAIDFRKLVYGASGERNSVIGMIQTVDFYARASSTRTLLHHFKCPCKAVERWITRQIVKALEELHQLSVIG